jgi:hypothetical protein
MHNGTVEAIKHPHNNSKEKKNGQRLDTVMESVKTSTLASAEAPSIEGKASKKSNKAAMVQTISETGLSEVPAEARPSESALILLKHLLKSWNSLCDMLQGSSYQRSRLPKQNNMPRI